MAGIDSRIVFTYCPHIRTYHCRYYPDELAAVYAAFICGRGCLGHELCIGRVFYSKQAIFEAMAEVYYPWICASCYHSARHKNDKRIEKS